MRRFDLRSFVVPLVLAAFLLPVLILLLQGDGLPCTHDNIFHSYRIVAMREMLRFGWLFSRWVPNLALGYGYPFFNYREPLPYLVAEAVFAIGTPLPLVLGGLYAGSLIAAAWGAYVLARDLFGERAGWIAAVGYGLAPYLLLDVLRRGNMPESIGLAMLPWLFVSTRRLILGKSRRNLVVTTLLLTALFLTHNISSLMLAPFLGAYVVLLAWLHRDRKAWMYAFVAVGIAVLVTAWFWLPALTEQDLVQLHLSRSTRNNDFHYNFLTWREMLFSLPVPYDPDYLNPPMRISLGLVQAGLAVVGVVLGLVRGRGREQRWLVGLFLAAAVLYLWMATPGSVWLWEAVPLLSFVQFPWRLVGRALLPVCLLAGLAVEMVCGWLAHPTQSHSLSYGSLGGSRKRGTPPLELSPGGGRGGWLSSSVVLIVLGALVLFAWPETYPPKGMCSAGLFPDLEALYAREQEGWIGMDPESSYFPIWVEEHPDELALAGAFMAGTLPERFDPAALPAGAEVVETTYRPLGAVITVASPESFQGRWLGLYFPGWQVLIDGDRVAVAPEDDTGLLVFDVPAGEHEIRVRFGTTPMRAAGTWLAVLGLVIAVGTWVVPGLRVADATPAVPRMRRSGLVWAVLVLASGLLVVRLVAVGRVPTPVQRPRVGSGALPDVSVSLNRRFDGGMALLGYSVRADSVPSDRELTVDLLWQAYETPTLDARTSVLLRSLDGQVWSPAGTARPRGYEPMPPTDGWRTGAYAYDGHIVIPFVGTPPGSYDVVVAIFDKDTLVPLSPLDAEGRPSGPDLVVGTVRIESPTVPLARADLASKLARCGPLAFLDVTLDREVGVPGGLLAVRWVWEAVETTASDLEAQLTLVTPDGAVVREWTLAPAAAWWPTDRWSIGDLWVGRHVLRLPGDLESGVHELRVTADGCDEVLGRVALELVAPERAWALPEGLTPDAIVFRDQTARDQIPRDRIALVGHTLTPEALVPGDVVEVHLAWQALAPVEISYRIYLHLQDADGSVVDQSDGEPAGWSRPTTGWATGEIVSDVRSVGIPEDAAAGDYMMRVGVYAPDGARLVTAEGDDGTTLATIEVR